MTVKQRNEIEKAISAFEAARFQEFMLRFLPLYHSIYEGMIRNGHNADGKTCKGTPDLIKHCDNGNQIGCECGTGSNYWKKPKDLNKRKPIMDGEKCLKKVKKLVKLVLACSQPSPSDSNIKNKIITHFRARCSIVILSSKELAFWVEANKHKPIVTELIRDFFHDLNLLNNLDHKSYDTKKFLSFKEALQILYEKTRFADKEIDWGISRERYTYHQLIDLIEQKNLKLYGCIYLMGRIHEAKIEEIPKNKIPNGSHDGYLWDKDYEQILSPLKEILYVDVCIHKEKFKEALSKYSLENASLMC